MESVPDRSHISRLGAAPNANTRLVPAGPRVEVLWLDEAYARARAIEASLPPGPHVRLAWWRGEELGFRDLPASMGGGGAYAVVGRHSCCDIVLPSDPAVALRHLMVRAIALDDGAIAVRVLDLKTGLGFHLDDDVERRAIVASGPVALRIGRYALVALPSGEAPASRRPPTEVLDSVEVPSLAPRDRITHVTTLPRAPVLDDIARDVAQPGFAKVTLRRGNAWASVELTEADLDAGVLVGRAERCEPRLRAVLTESVSRTHVALLRERGVVHAYDLASTQGVYVDDLRVRRVRLPDRGGTLRLASRDPVFLEWHPRAALAS